MEKPLLPLALVPLAVGLALISVAIGSQKTGKRAQKDPFACLLDAHGRCRHVDHREPTRMITPHGRFWLYSKVFVFLGNLPITLVLHEAPTGTQE